MNFNKVARHSLVSAVLMVLVLLTASADTKPRNTVPTSAQIYGNFAWTKQKWIGNNVPYQKARTKVDVLVASGVQPEALVKAVAVQAQQHPSDALFQFRWGYATYVAVEDPKVPDEVGRERLEKVLVALISAKPPHVYDYDRLHFLALAYSFPPPQIVTMGLRLLHKNPNDFQVKYAVACILDDSNNAGDRQKAIVFANELATQFPNTPKYYGLLAGTAYSTWFNTKSHVDAENAITAYQRYLDMAPSDYAFRSNAQACINFIRQQQAHWDKGNKLSQ